MPLIFQPLRTRRIDVTLQEIRLGEAISCHKLPANRLEMTTTEVLRAIAAKAIKSTDERVTDPLLWTVQERTHLICHYLSSVSEDGPDFSVSSNSKWSDYADFATDLSVDQIDLGVVSEKHRILRPLLGVHAQALELLCHSPGAWEIGAVACQVQVIGEEVPDWLALSEPQIVEWIKGRIDLIKNSYDGWFANIYHAWLAGNQQLAHFYRISFDDLGVICLPIENEEAAGEIPAARFLSNSCLSEESRICAR